MRRLKTLLAATLYGCTMLFSPMSMAQDELLGCEYDENMASVVCVVNNGPLTLEDIAINGGQCQLWDHRLVRATLARELHSAGQIVSETDYAGADIPIISAAVLKAFQDRKLDTGDFFRFEAYRCNIKTITLKTSAGVFDFRTQ